MFVSNVVLQTRLPVVVAEVGHGREALGLGLAVAGGVEIRPPAGAGQKAWEIIEKYASLI